MLLFKRRIRFDNLKYDFNTKEFLVREYFRRITSRDIQGLLNLFSDDSVIHEPFSKSSPLSGKSEIESFLRSVIMANEGVQSEIKIEKQGKEHENNVVAIVKSRKENSIKFRFKFKLENADKLKLNRWTIKALNIEFMD